MKVEIKSKIDEKLYFFHFATHVVVVVLVGKM